jgi:hypothetical protein
MLNGMGILLLGWSEMWQTERERPWRQQFDLFSSYSLSLFKDQMNFFNFTDIIRRNFECWLHPYYYYFARWKRKSVIKFDLEQQMMEIFSWNVLTGVPPKCVKWSFFQIFFFAESINHKFNYSFSKRYKFSAFRKSNWNSMLWMLKKGEQKGTSGLISFNLLLIMNYWYYLWVVFGRSRELPDLWVLRFRH